MLAWMFLAFVAKMMMPPHFYVLLFVVLAISLVSKGYLCGGQL
jgi:hypothetical protein